MNRIQIDENVLQQLRAIEAEILRTSSPVPEDPVQTVFQFGFVRAADRKSLNKRRAPLTTHNLGFHPRDDSDNEAPRERPLANRRNTIRLRNPTPPRSPPLRGGVRRQHDLENDRNEPERRRRRAMNREERAAAEQELQQQQRRRIIHDIDLSDDDIEEVDNRRPLSPTELPGVRAIPKEYNRMFRGLLTPGEYFAKSHTRYLGPFDNMPSADTLPARDNYIILQRMGRLPDSGKSIFRQVGTLLT